MAEAQSLSNHRKFVPLYHFFVLPVLLANTVFVIIDAKNAFSGRAVFDAMVAFSLFVAAVFIRVKATGNQNRIIRNEERERMRAVLPPDMQQDIGRFTTGQLVGMRFASDAELPELAKSVLANGSGQAEVKKQIKTWRADHQRV